MNLVKVCVILLWAFFSTIDAQQCHTLNTQSCQHFDMIKYPILHAFFSEESMPNFCSLLGTALQCAINRLKTCSEWETVTFSVQYEVYKIVCTERKEEHRKSSKCLTRPNINRNVVQQCLAVDRCSNVDRSINCATNYLSRIDGCTATDVAFFRDLAQAYLGPVKSFMKCNKTSLDGDVTSKPPSWPTTTPGLDQTRSSARGSTSISETGTTRESTTLSNARNQKTSRMGVATGSTEFLASIETTSAFNTETTTDNSKSDFRPTVDFFEPPNYNARILEHTQSETSHRNMAAGQDGIEFFCLMSSSLYCLYYIMMM